MPYMAATAIAGAIFAVGTAAYAITVAVLTAVFTLAANYLMQELFGRKPPSADIALRDNVLTIRQATAPWEYVYGTVRKGGTYAFLHTTDNNHFLHMIIVVADHEVTALGDVYFDDDLVPFDGNGDAVGKYAGYARCVKMLGSPDQLALQELIDAAPDKWTEDHRLREKAYLYLRLRYNTDLYSSIPNVSVVVEGKAVYNPRDEAQDPDDPDTWEYSETAADCLADYIADSNIGLSGKGDIFEDDWIAAGNACDEAVPLSVGGTEPRYACSGIVSSDLAHRQILEAILTSFDGEIIPVGNRWRINAGVWRDADISLDESDLRGPVTTRTRRPKKELYNGVRGVFNSPKNQYVAADFPAVISDAFVTLDGEENFFDISLPFTKSEGAAQRIAKIQLLKSRQQILTTWPCKLTAFAVQAGDNVTLSRTALGWEDKNFKVTKFALSAEDGDEGNAPYLGVDLTLEETDPTIYNWTTDEEITVDPAPDTNLPDPFNISPPMAVNCYSGDNYLKKDGAGQPINRILVEILPPSDAFVDHYDLQWRHSDDPDWSDVPVIADRSGGNSYHWIEPAVDEATYYFRVASKGRRTGTSDWIEETHVVEPKSTRPSDVTTFTVGFQGDGTREIRMTHTNAPSDVKNGGGYNIYVKSGGSIGDSDYVADNLLNRQGLIQSFPLEFNSLAAGVWTFACQAVDSNGLTSPNPKTFTVTLPEPRVRDSLFDQSETTADWPGTLTDCVKVAGDLIGTATEDIDDLPATIAELPATILELVSRVGSFTYETEVFDLTADVTFTPIVTTTGDGSATITMKTGSSADGDVTGSYGALAAVTGKRYLQIKVVWTGARLRDVLTVVDGAKQIDEYDDVNTATEAADWFESVATGHFKIGSKSGNMASITRAQIEAFQGSSGEWTSILVSKAETVDGEPAAEFKTYLNGSLANGVFDIILKGPKK